MNQYINKIYEMEMEYFNGYESFCYQNCLRILLQGLNYKHPELYINAARTLRIGEENSTPYFCPHQNMRGLLPSIYDNVVRTYEEDGAEEVWRKNMAFLCERDEPIVVGVDTYHLMYASNYKKNHAKHTMILCGYDLKKGEVYVIDWYAPWFYRGKVNIKDFLRARSSINEKDGTIYSGRAINNNWAYINKFEPREPKVLLSEVINTSMKYFFLTSGEHEGVGSILEMCDILKSRNNCDINCDYLYRDVLSIIHRVQFFLQYLERFDVYQPGIIPISLRERLAEMKGDWEIVQFLFMKQLRSGTKENILKIAKRMERIYQKEIGIGTELQKIAGGL